ncbi:phosphotransferase [Sanguibacter sp. HDW7]|uniref:phosphotransferase n=1 Tax=Sanguibacter sp. HDW7 TaxID=2714931 RepID=UPI00140A75B3|nr:phosphotransferase [Sanguibacter sp. HDW7]QIK83654.1 phosphotransferase [Sanguibacter sp. HDW7]
MTQAPPADVDVTAELVRALLSEQHPDLADLPLVVVAHGWDNVVLRLGDALAVRVPRRTEAAGLVAHELRALPAIAAQLPATVPAAVRAGGPSAALGYPWVWAVVPWTEGVVVADLARPARAQLAEPLADVLVALHVPAPADAPHNPVRGVPLATRTGAVRERLTRLAAPGGYLATSGLVPTAPTDDRRAEVAALLARLERMWDDGLAAPVHAGPPLWVHGDLHAANLVATPDSPHTLAAVVDWGDVTAGDPATDLAIAWLVLDAHARRRFWDRLRAGGHPAADDCDARARARAWALSMATAMAEHAAPGTGHHALATGALAELLGLPAPVGSR